MRIRLAGPVAVTLLLASCAAPLADGSEKDEQHAAEHGWGYTALSTTEDRYMLFEGSCHFLACCAKRNCSLADSRVVGACGTGCSDTNPWIARPDRDRRYACGECVRVCVRGTSTCVNATVWDNSVTSSRIEGNVALFDALGLAHSDNPSRCTGTGGAWVTVGPCTGGADSGSEPAPAEDPPPADDPAPESGAEGIPAEEPPPADPGPAPAPSADACTCDGACGYCWCGTPSERACPDRWYGTGDGCDCGCQWTDPDCAGAEPPPIPEPRPEPSEPASSGGTFAGVYCTHRGWGCGGNFPCWPASDCPSGSTCDWAEGSWGRCMR
jgi:hypothetical protein